MSAAQMNAFLRAVAADRDLQIRLRSSDAPAAATLAATCGFDVSVGDLMRYKARATTWQLLDDELAVVAQWQPVDQPFWWQHMWPIPGPHPESVADDDAVTLDGWSCGESWESRPSTG